MKVMQIARLRSTDHAQMREGLETFEKHGAPGMETMWMSADARTVVIIYEVDDPSDLHKRVCPAGCGFWLTAPLVFR